MRRIKILFLTAVLALALTAVGGASSASASGGITFSQFPATVAGGEQGTHVIYLSTKAFACSMGGFKGTASGPTENLRVGLVNSVVKCTNENEGETTLRMNGCEFIYHPAVGTGSVDIGPVGCGPVTMEGGYWGCTRSFAPQKGMSASFSNNATSPTSVNVEDNMSLSYTITKGTKAGCGSGGTAGLFGQWLLAATNEEAKMIDAQVVPNTGLFMTGSVSEEASKQPKFAAESYSVAVNGSQKSTALHALTIGGNRTVQCAEVDAVSKLTAASSSLPLTMRYNACTLTTSLGSEFPTTVSTNSCTLNLAALNQAPLYSGSAAVACSKEGDGIELNVSSAGTAICTYKISPQSGLSSVSLSTVGEGKERGIDTTFNLSGITVSRVKGTVAACGGATQSATYTGGTVLHGVSY